MTINFAADFFVLAGALILVGALVPLCRLISKLPTGPVRGHWNTMLAFVAVFLGAGLAMPAHAQTARPSPGRSARR